MKKALFILLLFTASCNSKKGIITEIKQTSDTCNCIYVASVLDITQPMMVGIDRCGKYKLNDTVLIDSLK
jgi:hypothetical protein